MNASWLKSRGLVERIVVTGNLVLDTPTHLGNGDADGPLDMPIIVDPLEGKTLLTGASVAGALRAYVHERNHGWANTLFGKLTAASSQESPLIVDDAIGEAPNVELRDGVAINAQTRTAEEGKKYDMELLEAGTSFKLSFELLVRKDRANVIREAFVLALQGLERGDIHLGKRKRRGFGKCHVSEWTVRRYDMTTPEGMLAWLHSKSKNQQAKKIAEALHVVPDETQLQSCDFFTIKATFGIDSSVLIRSGAGKPDAPDVVHLRSKRQGREQLILSGTSIAGALRTRALQISNTFHPDKGWTYVEGMFGMRSRGVSDNRDLTASKLWVDEVEIDHAVEQVQTRVKIDRFTGGAYPGALFSEQAAFAQDTTCVTLRLSMKSPTEGQVGLLLLLLKDLWISDLPIGGGSNIGRGYLKGKHATLQWGKQSWEIELDGNQPHDPSADKERLQITGDVIDKAKTPAQVLQDYVSAFHREVM